MSSYRYFIYFILFALVVFVWVPLGCSGGIWIRAEEDSNGDGTVDRVSTFGGFEPGNWMSVFSEL